MGEIEALVEVQLEQNFLEFFINILTGIFVYDIII